eukprot:c3972_g1_i1.p1 GENE.c3972_g1_i1~~c3972_g1_i1.p1  ORF type:complete len:397 (+),score=145.16 c3972_g1_i1:65-1255(+)
MRKSFIPIFLIYLSLFGERRILALPTQIETNNLNFNNTQAVVNSDPAQRVTEERFQLFLNYFLSKTLWNSEELLKPFNETITIKPFSLLFNSKSFFNETDVELFLHKTENIEKINKLLDLHPMIKAISLKMLRYPKLIEKIVHDNPKPFLEGFDFVRGIIESDNKFNDFVDTNSDNPEYPTNGDSVVLLELSGIYVEAPIIKSILAALFLLGLLSYFMGCRERISNKDLLAIRGGSKAAMAFDLICDIFFWGRWFKALDDWLCWDAADPPFDCLPENIGDRQTVLKTYPALMENHFDPNPASATVVKAIPKGAVPVRGHGKVRDLFPQLKQAKELVDVYEDVSGMAMGGAPGGGGGAKGGPKGKGGGPKGQLVGMAAGVVTSEVSKSKEPPPEKRE